MYRLLIVDDEEIEREGMANFIAWDEYEIEMIGTAQNGVEGIKKIKELKPDIVLTDIKMPIMNGIEMIRQVKKINQVIEFVVLSGYGEYEFTNQAMEEGVRHYLLKPCDEEQIKKVIAKLKNEIQENNRLRKIQRAATKLFPKAKEQIFREMLTNGENGSEEYKAVLKEWWSSDGQVLIVVFQIESGFDYLEKFIVGNILTELLGAKNIYFSTSIQKDIIFLIDERAKEKLKEAIDHICFEFKRISSLPMRIAVSKVGRFDETEKMYQQVLQLLKIGVVEQRKGLICHEMFQEMQEDMLVLIDYRKIQETEDLGVLLFELYLLFIKMDLKEYSFEKKEETINWILKVLYGISLDCQYFYTDEYEKLWELLEKTLELLIGYKKMKINKGKVEEVIKSILLAIFRYLSNPNLSIQFLAKEVLYMNEDYLSRLFVKNRKEKFSTYLQEQRILLAQRILQYDPKLKISIVAEMVGYSPDGQYFSKTFRKIVHMTPTEYKAKLKSK